MSVAASSPAWFTRRAEERNLRCSAVRGFLRPVLVSFAEDASLLLVLFVTGDACCCDEVDEMSWRRESEEPH